LQRPIFLTREVKGTSAYTRLLAISKVDLTTFAIPSHT